MCIWGLLLLMMMLSAEAALFIVCVAVIAPTSSSYRRRRRHRHHWSARAVESHRSRLILLIVVAGGGGLVLPMMMVLSRSFLLSPCTFFCIGHHTLLTVLRTEATPDIVSSSSSPLPDNMYSIQGEGFPIVRLWDGLCSRPCINI